MVLNVKQRGVGGTGTKFLTLLAFNNFKFCNENSILAIGWPLIVNFIKVIK